LGSWEQKPTLFLEHSKTCTGVGNERVQEEVVESARDDFVAESAAVSSLDNSFKELSADDPEKLGDFAGWEDARSWG